MSAPSTLGGAERIASAFGKNGKVAALMPYVMGGFPTLAKSREIAHAYVEAGADLIELGVPYSDPLADGPVIQAAGTTALRQGTTLDEVIELGRDLAPLVPVVLMTYVNIVLGRGLERFAADLREAGISGVIMPDLPLEEADVYLEALDAADVALVPLIAPTTPNDRMARIGARARGFLYVVATIGTTGERASLAQDIGDLLARARACTSVPIALGFGISSAQQARQAADLGAQGIIIASRLVRAAKESTDPVQATGEIVASLATALHSGSG